MWTRLWEQGLRLPLSGSKSPHLFPTRSVTPEGSGREPVSSLGAHHGVCQCPGQVPHKWREREKGRGRGRVKREGRVRDGNEGRGRNGWGEGEKIEGGRGRGEELLEISVALSHVRRSERLTGPWRPRVGHTVCLG